MPTKLRKLAIDRVDLVRAGACPDAFVMLFKGADVDKEARSTSATNDLPDSSFAYISPGGKKDDTGRTVPRSLRHLPYRTSSGAIDKPHLRNALARLDQTDIPASAKASAKRKLEAAARSVGIEVGKAAPVCDDEGCDDADCPVHGTMKQADDDCTCTENEKDPDCPEHGDDSTKKKPMEKYDEPMGMHPEPDGDEEPPLDYASRGSQYDMWESLWGDWQCFCETVYDCFGDSDADNIQYLPILLRSIDQFKADVEEELAGLGLAEKMAPALATLTEVAKAGATMAGHRLKRFQDALTALQQILEECTPEDLPHGIQPPINRAGFSAAEAAGIPGYMKGASAMATTAPDLTAELDGLRKRAAAAEARVAELEPLATRVAELEGTITKMQQTPEEQEAAYWASVPEVIRKKHEADEAEKVELRKQLEEARVEREQTVYIAKTAEFRGFGMVSKHWRVFKALDTLAPEYAEEREELLRLMKASSARDMASDVYKAVGSEGRYGANGMIESTSANDQLMAMTESYAQEHECSFAKASEKIAKAHPDLYRRAREEQQRASRVSSD